MNPETWGTLRDDGASAYYAGGQLRLRAQPELQPRVREAVAARVDAMRRPVKLPLMRPGQCDTCGGELEGHQAGGWCPLCEMARRLVLR